MMLDDYFKANPGVKNLPWPGIESQSPNPHPPVVIAMSYDNDAYFPFVYFFTHFLAVHKLKYYWET